MRTTTSRGTRNVLLALAVSGALGFGATRAFAGPAWDAACNVSHAQGTCRTRTQCANICASLGTSPAFSACRDNCCYCDVQQHRDGGDEQRPGRLPGGASCIPRAFPGRGLRAE